MALCKFPSSIRAALLIAAALVIATAMRPALAQEGVEIAVESFQSDAEGRLAADVVVTLPPIAGRATVLGTLESEPPASGVYRVEFLADGATEPVEYEVTASQFGLTEAQLPIFLANVVAIGAGGGGSPEPPDAPANLVATAGDGEVELTWDAVPSVDGYQVWQLRDGDLLYQHLTSDGLAETNSFTATGLDNGVEYTFYVVASRNGILSGQSNTDSATPLHAPQSISGLEVMLYPPDTSTITHVAGATSKIVDLQNGHEAAQATGSKQPTTGSATINGLNVLSFDGGDCLQIANLTLPTNITVFVVTELTVDAMLVEHSAQAGAGAAHGFYMYSPGGSSFLLNHGGTQTGVNVADWMDGGPNIGIAKYDGATSKIYRNGGTALGSQNAVVPQADLTTTLNIMARNNAASLPSTGKLGALLIFDGGLSVANLNLVGAWLATKFGITWTTITA